MSLINQIESRNLNVRGYLIGAAVGVLILSALVFVATRRPSMQDQAAAILEGSYHPGSPEFEAISKDLIFATSRDTVESPNAFGSISMWIVGTIKNRGTRTINGLEVNVAVIDQFNEVVKEKRVLVVPTQQAHLGPGETIPITLSIEGFKKGDDRANIRWTVTAVRVAS